MTAELPNAAHRPVPRAPMKIPRLPPSVRDLPDVPPPPVRMRWRVHRRGPLRVETVDGVVVHSDPTGMWATSFWPLAGRWARRHGTTRWKKVRGLLLAGSWVQRLIDDSHAIGLEGPPSTEERTAWSTVPEDVATFVRDGCVEETRWVALELLSRFPAARELARDVPFLASLLVERSAFSFDGGRWRTVGEWLAPLPGMRAWRELAGRLGLDTSRAFVALLRRMPPGRWDRWDTTHVLQSVWTHDLARKRLLRASAPSRNAVRMLAEAVRLECVDAVRTELLDHEDLRHGDTALETHLRNAVSTWRLLHPGSPVPPLRSPDDVYALVERMRTEVRAAYGLPTEVEDTATRTLPPPPLADAPGIRALRTAQEFGDEGRSMQHCLGNGTWEASARARLGYAYAIELNGERASLWLSRNETRPGHFDIGEFKGPRNSPPTAGVRSLVTAWHAQQLRAIASGETVLAEEWVKPPFSLYPDRYAGIPQAMRWAFGEDDPLPF